MAARGANQFIGRAIDGFPGFPGALEIARRHLDRTGDVDRAVRDVTEQHIRLAGVQGFVTNIGGVVTMPVSVPANIAGIAVLHLRMAAAIAHLRGYDITDQRVRVAALLTLLGKDGVETAQRGRDIPGTPFDVATGINVPEPAVAERAVTAVSTQLVARIGGKHATLTVARRVPVLGGAVSAGVDAFSTYAIGRFANREFPPNVTVERA
ncbi:EcsC family protein [Haloactinopolyspora alba]|uniref:EcsC family protein n=2 Tax=Haloactinopolyspora alba TaxID=648780 RepID=A0A2P8E715_9ACTN|nr:EcsC family protein [Haloactinopolyspora alba]